MTLGCFSAFPPSDLILVIFLLLRLIKKAFTRILYGGATHKHLSRLAFGTVGVSFVSTINGSSQRSKDRSEKPSFESLIMHNTRRTLSSVR
jgi:hypothetical protein